MTIKTNKYLHMKKLVLTFAIVFSLGLSAQTAYEKAMTSEISKLAQAKSGDELVSIANDFQRIADKEKTNWLPYYYAAYSQIMKGRTEMRANKTDQLDAICDAAQKYLDKSMELSKDNAENYILSKMIHGMRMLVDPMSRYQTEGALQAEALAKATTLDPENPRITIQKAEDAYFTPAQFGGSKEEGIKLFQKAKEQFANYKPKSALDPNWGKEEIDYFLSQKLK